MLAALRNADGGFPPAPGGQSEPEPTALAAIALNDDGARAWLRDAQDSSGGFFLGAVSLRSDSETPLAALALPEGAAREKALDYVVSHQAPKIRGDDRVPHDPNTRGWGWTSTTFGWVEPTSRALLALKILRSAAPEIADGDAVMSDRECHAGGWNYGNREVLGTLYPPFLQTTAAGLLGVQDRTDGIRERAVAVIHSLWRTEPGGLGWAMASAALHAIDRPDQNLDGQLELLVTNTRLDDDTVALAWATIALGGSIDTIRIAT